MTVTYLIVETPKLEIKDIDTSFLKANPFFYPVEEPTFDYSRRAMNDTLYDDIVNPTESISDSIVPTNKFFAAIQNHLGERYNQAKRNLPGFSDCSSFVGKVLKDAGINVFNGLPTAAAMYNSDKLKSVSKAKPGDLIFFRGTDRRGKNYVSHVGIVAEVDDNGNPTKMAHASARQFKKSVIVDYNANYWNKFRPEIKRINV